MAVPKGYCELCGRHSQLEEHHVFPGPFRKASEKYKMKAYICPECHRIGRMAVHRCEAMANALKARYQRIAMEIYAWDTTEWVEHFGKNYTEPEPEREEAEEGYFQITEDRELLI